jgi:hypothetical protein
MNNNPTSKQCATRAANYNRNGFVVKNKQCYITKPNINVNNIPNNSFYASNYPIKSRWYNKNNTIKATVFKNGDFGMGYTKNNDIIPSYGWWSSTINRPATGCDLNGSMIKVKDATYRNNAIM